MPRSISFQQPQWKRKAMHGAVALAVANIALVSAAWAAPVNGCSYSAALAYTASANVHDCVASNVASLTVNNGVTISSSANPFALYFSGDLGAAKTLDNNGTISGTGIGSSVNPISGVHIDNELLGTLNNHTGAVISATATALTTESVFASAIYEGSPNSMQGTLNNVGSIVATATASSGNASAAGIAINNNIAAAATLSNGSTITSTANSGSGNAQAIGIAANSLSGLLDNSGSISATANSSTGSSGVSGIFINGEVSSTGILRNSGSISGSQSGSFNPQQQQLLYWPSGVTIGILNGTLENSGTISASSASGISIGAMLGQLNGTVNNSGTISASGGVIVASIVSMEGGSGTVNNLASGTLRGLIALNGTVNLNNDGLIDLASGSQLATSNIGGNYHQSATGTLRISATSTQGEGGYSSLHARGTATIAGKAFVDVASVNTLQVGQSLVGVVTGSTVSGNFSQVSDNSAMFDFRSVHRTDHGERLDFDIIKGLTATQAANSDHNNPALGAARVFDDLVDAGNSSGDMQTVITAMGQLPTEREVSRAVSQTLPLLTAGTAQATSGALHGTNRVVQSRQEGQHGRSTGDSLYSDRKVWVKPFASQADQDDHGGVSGYQANTYGVVIGADAEVGASNRLGVAFAYARSDVDGNSSDAKQSAKVSTYQLVGYGSHSLNANTDLSFQADIGMHQTNGDRQINFGGLSRLAKSDYDSWSAHLGGGIARTMVLSERTSFTPSLRADYTVIHDSSYSETGADALNLNVGQNRTEEMIVSLDGKLSYALSDRTTLVGNIGGGYDLMSKQASINAAFAGSPSASFSTKGLDPSPWLARAGLGVVKKISDKTELSARYDVELRQGFSNQTASVKARWMF